MNGADLIRRSDAEKVLCDACGNAACPKGLIPKCSYFDKMQAIPAVDAVEVVRCECCRYGTIDQYSAGTAGARAPAGSFITALSDSAAPSCGEGGVA